MEQVRKLVTEGVRKNVSGRPDRGLLTTNNLEPSVQWLAADRQIEPECAPQIEVVIWFGSAVEIHRIYRN